MEDNDLKEIIGKPIIRRKKSLDINNKVQNIVESINTKFINIF